METESSNLQKKKKQILYLLWNQGFLLSCLWAPATGFHSVKLQCGQCHHCITLTQFIIFLASIFSLLNSIFASVPRTKMFITFSSHRMTGPFPLDLTSLFSCCYDGFLLYNFVQPAVTNFLVKSKYSLQHPVLKDLHLFFFVM
jgi:hypothetical protein